MVGSNAIRFCMGGTGVLALLGAARIPGERPIPDGATAEFHISGACLGAIGPEYYAFELVTTGRVPGSGLAAGRAEVSVSPSSPFVVALAADGSYEYDVHISVERLKRPRQGVLVAWITTRELDEVRRFGVLDEYLQATGRSSWNKFLVVISLETTDDPSSTRWSGPVALRGMSRSGMMHTMAGHGAFQQENCAAYGYDD